MLSELRFASHMVSHVCHSHQHVHVLIVGTSQAKVYAVPVLHIIVHLIILHTLHTIIAKLQLYKHFTKVKVRTQQ